ncbi:hypothetical protein M3Y98_00158400 [Aphelenchoides besseyi]|nr:hypothetical protein M3Y98_00158400 [Aphelenchoides besseyi]KAI6199886.1 hypothetical protein M3Y96_00674900 [Aphelenchoides besseyi]
MLFGRMLLTVAFGLLVVVFCDAVPSLFSSQLTSNKDCGFPNGTETKFYAYNCDSTTQIQVNGADVFDNSTGKPMYPVDFKKKILIKLNAFNSGGSIRDNKADVSIDEYSYSWIHSDCRWSSIPTFGLLNNIDGCEFAHNCPLKSGKLTLQLPLDLTKFASIIQFIAGNKPYQLTIKMRDGDHPKKVVACVVAQLHFKS